MDSMEWVWRLVAAATALNTSLLAVIGFFTPRIARRFKAEEDLAATSALAKKTAMRCDNLAAEHGRFREDTRVELDRVRLKSEETARAVGALKDDVRDGFAELKDDLRDGLAEVKQRLDLFLQQQVVPPRPPRRRTRRTDG